MTPLEKAALKHAAHASKAPDKETPDWIITDFKAGAKWQAKQDKKDINKAKKLLDKVIGRHYVATRLKRQILNYLGLPF